METLTRALLAMTMPSARGSEMVTLDEKARSARNDAKRRALLLRTLRNLAERYHGDAGCLTAKWSHKPPCPACEALGLLENL